MKKTILLFTWALLSVFPFFLESADIALVTIAAGKEYQDAVELGIQNKREYCKKHNYDFIYVKELPNSDQDALWNKIKILQKMLNKSAYKWVFWSDAESLIMNQDLKLEFFTDDNFHIITSKNNINPFYSGQFLIKNSQWSKNFLKKLNNLDSSLNKENENIISKFKTYPARILNSIYLDNSNISKMPQNKVKLLKYRKGDFIIHFDRWSTKEDLKNLMTTYSNKINSDIKAFSLDHYLQIHGYELSPTNKNKKTRCCYVTNMQKQQLTNLVLENQNIQSVLEIGLNAGHSAEIFFSNLNNIQFYSFDINCYPYTQIGVDYFKTLYGNNFQFFSGNSLITVPNFVKNNPNTKVDLIYIDGNHKFEFVYNDIKNCKELAHENTILLLDDYNPVHVGSKKAIDQLVSEKLIEVIETFDSLEPGYDKMDMLGRRTWARAKYCF